MNTMNITTKSTNPVKALRFLVPVLGLAIALFTTTAATAQPAAPEKPIQASSYENCSDFYWAPSAGAVNYEVFVDYYGSGSFQYTCSVSASSWPFNGCPTVTLSIPVFSYYPSVNPSTDGYRRIKVRAVDAAGNKSDFSPELKFGWGPCPHDHIAVSSPTVKVGETFTLSTWDCYYDEVEIFEYPEDGTPDDEINYKNLHDNGTLIAYVNVFNHSYWDWNGNPPEPGQPPVYGPAEWYYFDAGYCLQYETQGSRLLIGLVEYNAGSHRYASAVYSKYLSGSPDVCSDIWCVHVNVIP